MKNANYGGEKLILWKTGVKKMLVLGKANLENGNLGEDRAEKNAKVGEK